MPGWKDAAIINLICVHCQGGNNATGSRAFTGPESIHVEAARRRLQEMDANLIFSSPRLMLDPDFIQLSSPTLWSITD